MINLLNPVSINNLVTITKLYTLYHFKYNKNYKFVGESHNFWEIVYVDKGCIVGFNGNEPYHLEAGQLIFHRPNVFHSLGGNGQDDFNIIVISFECKSKLFETFQQYIFRLTPLEKDIIQMILKEGYCVHNKPSGKNLIFKKVDGKSVDEESTIGSKQMIKVLLELLLIYLYRKAQNQSHELVKLSMQSLSKDYLLAKEVITYLEDNVYNNIDFESVLKKFNISGTSLKRIFKTVTGYSVMQYYRAIVLEKIKIEMYKGDKNFTEISDKFNFSSIHYFSKFFKNGTGQSPSSFVKIISKSKI